MKLTYFQLEPHLSKQLLPCYMLSGDDPLLKQDGIDLVRHAAKRAGFSERQRITVDASFDWDSLYSLLNATSLFADKRLLELDFRQTLPTKSASGLLQAYAKQPSSDMLILIDLPKVDDKIAKSAWYTALDKVGVSIALWPIPRDQLPPWILQRAKRHQLSLPLPVANSLADYVEGNLTAAAQTLEKLSLLGLNRTVEIEDIHAILSDDSRFTLFDLTDALLAGQHTRALHILEYLQTDGTEPVLVLWAITRELRQAANMAQLIKQGHKWDALFQQFRVFAKRQPLVRRFLTKHSQEDCWNQLIRANDLDKIIKGATPGNAWQALQLFCIGLV